MRVVAESDNCETAVLQIKALQPDIAVLDLDVPNFSGFEVTRKLSEDGVNIPIVILTIHGKKDLFQEAIDLGIKGHLVKDQALMEIVRGLHTVFNGNITQFVAYQSI